MKRLLVLLAVAVLAFGLTAQAQAAVKFGATGYWHTLAGYDQNQDFSDQNNEDNVWLGTRFRATFTAEANEYVRGVWMFQVGQLMWGQGDNLAGGHANQGGGPIDANTRNFKTRLVYAQVMVPHTSLNISAGIQDLTLPSATGFKNPVYNSRTGSIIVSAKPADNISVAAFYGRPVHNAGNGGLGAPTPKGATKYNEHNSWDIFGVLATLKLDNITVQPYVVGGILGNAVSGAYGALTPNGRQFMTDNYKKDTTLILGGAALTLNVSKELAVKLDAIFGTADAPKWTDGTKADTTGFFVDLLVDYKMGFGTPGVFAWYSSGNQKRDKGGVLPMFASDNGFGPTRLGFQGALTLGRHSWISSSAAGTLGAGLQVKDMSFAEKLSHVARVAYIKGTNNKNAWYDDSLLFVGGNTNGVKFQGLSEQISFIEVDFDTTYEIAPNVKTILELSYILPKLEKDVKRVFKLANNNKNAVAGYQGQIGLYYNF